MTKKSKQVKRNKIAKAEMQQEVVKSAVVVPSAPKSKRKVAVTPAHKAKATKLPADLDVRKIPALDRTPKTKKEQEAFEAKRQKLIEEGQRKSATQSALLRGVTSPAPRESNLTEADKKAIAELTTQQQAKKAALKATGLAKLKEIGEKRKAERAEVAAVKKAAKEKQAAEKKTRTTADKAKIAKRVADKAKAVWEMLSRKNGASNSEFVEKLGFRWNIGPMQELAKKHGYKLDVSVVDGIKRYAKGKKIG